MIIILLIRLRLLSNNMLSIARNLSRPTVRQNIRRMSTEASPHRISDVMVIPKVLYGACALTVFTGLTIFDGLGQIKINLDEYINKYYNENDLSNRTVNETAAEIEEKYYKEVGVIGTIGTFTKGSVKNLEFNIGSALIFPIAIARERIYIKIN